MKHNQSTARFCIGWYPIDFIDVLVNRFVIWPIPHKKRQQLFCCSILRRGNFLTGTSQIFDWTHPSSLATSPGSAPEAWQDLVHLIATPNNPMSHWLNQVSKRVMKETFISPSLRGIDMLTSFHKWLWLGDQVRSMSATDSFEPHFDFLYCCIMHHWNVYIIFNWMNRLPASWFSWDRECISEPVGV